MIDQTPDEWLLEEFDRWGSLNESIHIRPMFQVLLDPPCTCMFLDMEDEEGFRECEGSINDRSSWSADPDYFPPTWYGVLLGSSCNNLFIKLMTEGLGNYSQAQPWGSIVPLALARETFETAMIAAVAQSHEITFILVDEFDHSETPLNALHAP